MSEQVASERHAAELEKINTSLSPHINGLLSKWRERGGVSLSVEPDPEPRPRSAIDVRLGWYMAERHIADTLENFVAVTPEQQDALTATRDWVEAVVAGRGGALALVGSVGTGKSHLLYAAVRAVNEAGKHCAAYGWWDLAEIRRDAKTGDDDARLKWGRFKGADAFALDEIRPTSGTDFDTTELSQLMTKVYRDRKGVIVTSNYADERLSRVVGLAATSRLTQVVVVGPNMRKPENRKQYLAS